MPSDAGWAIEGGHQVMARGLIEGDDDIDCKIGGLGKVTLESAFAEGPEPALGHFVAAGRG